MIPILYDAGETAFVSNGLGRLRDCISCIVTEERNGIFECVFEYPQTGAHFDMLQPGRIIAVRHDDTGDIQPFDIVGYTKPIDGVVTFQCVHISYRQSGIVAVGSNINTLADAFTMLESGEPSNPFNYSSDITATAFMASADGTPRSVRQFLGGIEGSILDTFGGEYEFDKFNVILHKSRGVVRDFSIRYGVNMLDYNEQTDYQGSYTSCVPFWSGQDNNGAEVKVIGNRVDSGAVSFNGRDECVPLDLSDKFETQPTTAELEAEALAQMQSKQTSLPASTIKVDFVRLQDMPEYEGYAPLFDCRLCDTVRVIFPYYGTSGEYKIVKTVYNVLREKFDALELGTLQTSLAEALGISQTLDKTGGGGGGVEPDDYVIELGTSGEWKFRKWKSGAVEAWIVHDFGSQSGTAWGGVYYKELNLSIPSGIFTTAPNRIYITGSGRQWWVVGYSSATTTQIQTIRFVRPVSSAATIWANVYAAYLP